MNAKIHILLVEDEKSSCSYITALLGKSGYHITTAMSGREGLEKAISFLKNVLIYEDRGAMYWA